MKFIILLALAMVSQAALAGEPPASCNDLAKNIAKSIVELTVSSFDAEQVKANGPVIRGMESSVVENVKRWTYKVGFPITTEDKFGNVGTYDTETINVTLAGLDAKSCYYVRSEKPGYN